MDYLKVIIQKVWEKATPVKGYNPDVLRKDMWGAWIIRDHFGHHHSEYAWEIDFINPNNEDVHDISNLRPLQWENKECKQGNQFIGLVTSLHVTNMRIR